MALHFQFLQGRVSFNEDGVKKIQFIIVDQYQLTESGEQLGIILLFKLVYKNPLHGV